MTRRSNLVKIKVNDDWKGIPKGTVLQARNLGFIFEIVDGEHAGKELGKAKVKVLRTVHPEKKGSAA